MPLIDLFLFGASLYMLRRSYFFLVDKNKAWELYVERQTRLGVKPKNLKRDREWERNATFQGWVYLGAGVLGLAVVGATFLG